VVGHSNTIGQNLNLIGIRSDFSYRS